MTTKKVTQATSNEAFLKAAQDEGREHVFLSELPFPQRAKQCGRVLAVEGNRVYLRSVTE